MKQETEDMILKSDNLIQINMVSVQLCWHKFSKIMVEKKLFIYIILKIYFSFCFVFIIENLNSFVGVFFFLFRFSVVF